MGGRARGCKVLMGSPHQSGSPQFIKSRDTIPTRWILRGHVKQPNLFPDIPNEREEEFIFLPSGGNSGGNSGVQRGSGGESPGRRERGRGRGNMNEERRRGAGGRTAAAMVKAACRRRRPSRKAAAAAVVYVRLYESARARSHLGTLAHARLQSLPLPLPSFLSVVFRTTRLLLLLLPLLPQLSFSLHAYL